MLSEDEPAPSFSLPGTDGGEFEEYALAEYTEEGVAVLAFYPFDFSPVCTDELCGFRDAEWLTLSPAVDVLGISTDACYAHRAFIDQYGLSFPLLSDTTGEVADRYGVAYEEWELHRGVSKRSVFVVDDEMTVRYAWSTDDAYDTPDLYELHEAIRDVHDPAGAPNERDGGA
ncbi:MAG: redoxin domain-containing protein [Haloarculaceae archaeon]